MDAVQALTSGRWPGVRTRCWSRGGHRP